MSRVLVATSVLCLAILSACSSAEQTEAAAFKNDALAVAALAKINRGISTRSVSPDDFAHLKTVYDKYPNAPDVRLAYRNALVLREDWATLENFLSAIPGDKLGPDDRRTLGKACVKTGKYDKAIQALKPLALSEPADVEVRSLLAASYYYLDRPDEAAAELDSVWDRVIAERRADAMTTRGLIFSRQNDLQKAIETLKAASDIDPLNGAALNALGQAYARQGDQAQADIYFKRTAEINDQSVARTLEGSRRVQQILELESAWNAKNYAKVIELVNQLLPTERPERKSILYQYLAGSHKALGNQREAETAMIEAQKQQR